MPVQVGDIILYPIGPTSRWISKVVGWGQRIIGQEPSTKSYSHVAIIGPDTDHIIEAYWPKIRISPLQLDGNEVYRIKGIKPAQVNKMITYALSRVGKWYDMLAIITLGFLHLGGTEVCSELVFNAGLAAGIVLYPPKYFESPDDISASALLKRIA